jgi:hypothetical protein
MSESIVKQFEFQAAGCAAYGSPFTGALIAAMLEDFRAGGPVAALIADWPGPPMADALSLRLAGAVHAAALSGRDAALAAAFPSQDAPAEIASVWPLARALLEREHAWVKAFIQSPPQTNETRRSIGLLAGFLAFAETFSGPIDTLELGASAGLNLYWDRFAYRTQRWSRNAGGAPLIDTDWSAPAPPLAVTPHIRARAGCDRNPLDVSDRAQRLQLKSYIWADQFDRLARFDAAADLAIAQRVRVDKADAADWVREKLAARARAGATIVYHSVFIQYPPRETRQAIFDAIAAAGEAATAQAPLGWLRLEPEGALGGPRDSARFFIDLITWPGGKRRLLGETDGHLRWVRPA